MSLSGSGGRNKICALSVEVDFYVSTRSDSRSGTDFASRFDCERDPVMKVLENDFTGIHAGRRMQVTTPLIVDAVMAGIDVGAIVDDRTEVSRGARKNRQCQAFVSGV